MNASDINTVAVTLSSEGQEFITGKGTVIFLSPVSSEKFPAIKIG
ncbi:Uncharacterized protein dnm_061900 [Desulfonema magnum]|uniref:Uncharacterized protein n=1 Tax=Desulfonema magnum TaxID=45655 RepID=A0A975BRZ8_9BACT|nr:Uncharacterized protein dnm_061900 [Desulfonema magnum]